MARKKKEPTLADLVSDTELLLKFRDLCEGCFRGDEGEVIIYVLESYFKNEGIESNAWVKERYEKARAKRLAGKA